MAFNAFMHERNIYRNQPDFAKLASDFPEFHKYVIFDTKGQKARVDFSNTEALRMLTKILLKTDFNLDIEIPKGYLVPTIPQRLNYILWLEDLLINISENESKKESICGIDIGTGACAIFAVLGARKNGWKFIATESSEDAIMWAKKNIEKNNLNDKITVVKVSQGGSSLKEVLSSNEDCYHFCMCNPPFFENSEEIRKKHPNSDETIADVAQKDEIFVKGGELDFVRNILKDSLVYKSRICLFTSMFGKKKNFLQILKDLKEIPDSRFTSTEFCQGNTIRWGVAWTFDQSVQFQKEVKKRSKPKKAKPPLEYQILISDSKDFKLDTFVKQAKVYLKSLEIFFTVVKSSPHFTELLLKSDKNTWTHQRRKRRELERQKKDGKNAAEILATVSSSENTDTPRQVGDGESLEHNLSSEENVNDVVLQDSSRGDTCSGNQKVDITDEMPCESNLPSESQSDAHSVSESKDSLLLQSSKRKLDLDEEDSTTCKKAKISDTESTVNESKHPEDSLLLQSSKRKLDVDANDLTVCKKAKISETENTENSLVESSKNETISNPNTNRNKTDRKNIEAIEPEGSVLHSSLQFIKGKNKVYVKMNCPPSADRNIMYQVFQLIKNKVNGS